MITTSITVRKFFTDYYTNEKSATWDVGMSYDLVFPFRRRLSCI